MEKRNEVRVPHHTRFFIHVHQCEERPEMVGKSVPCEAVDLSLHGLQFRTAHQLVPSSILNITVGVAEPFTMYLLQGRISWVHEAGGPYAMGIELRDAPGTDFPRWESEFDRRFCA